MELSEKSNNVASEKLMQLDIDLGSIKCENRTESINYWKFNSFCCEYLKNKTRKMIFEKNPSDEIDLKNIVYELSRILGVDSAKREVMLDYELLIYRNNVTPDLPIRFWDDFIDYYLELKANSADQSVSLCVNDIVSNGK